MQPLESFFPPQIKTGAPCRSERLAKYNQLMRYSGCTGPGHREVRAVGPEGHNSDLAYFLGSRRRLETRLSLLGASSVTQRPSEKLEVLGSYRTDLSHQALLSEINTGVKQDSGELLCGREEIWSLGWVKTGGRTGKGEQRSNLLGRGGSEGLHIGEVGLDLEQSSRGSRCHM